MIKSRITLAGALLAVAGAANAGFSVTPTVTSDYDWRGISQTMEDPAFQLGVNWTHDSGFYLGAVDPTFGPTGFAGYRFTPTGFSTQQGLLDPRSNALLSSRFVSQVGDLRRLHQIAYAHHVERAKLVPLSNEYECIRAGHRSVLVVGINNIGQDLHRFRLGHGIVGVYFRAILDQLLDDADRRRLAHVVRFWFEGEAKHGDCLSLQSSDELPQLEQHLFALVLVYIDHSIDDARRAIVVTRDRSQRSRVFRKTRATEAWTRVKKLATDSFVHADTTSDVMHVTTNPFTKIGNLVDE